MRERPHSTALPSPRDQEKPVRVEEPLAGELVETRPGVGALPRFRRAPGLEITDSTPARGWRASPAPRRSSHLAFGLPAYGSGVGHLAPVQTIRPWIDGEMGEFAMM
jgi:hypothetical protein